MQTIVHTYLHSGSENAVSLAHNHLEIIEIIRLH